MKIKSGMKGAKYEISKDKMEYYFNDRVYHIDNGIYIQYVS